MSFFPCSLEISKVSLERFIICFWLTRNREKKHESCNKHHRHDEPIIAGALQRLCKSFWFICYYAYWWWWVTLHYIHPKEKLHSWFSFLRIESNLTCIENKFRLVANACTTYTLTLKSWDLQHFNCTLTSTRRKNTGFYVAVRIQILENTTKTCRFFLFFLPKESPNVLSFCWLM